MKNRLWHAFSSSGFLIWIATLSGPLAADDGKPFSTLMHSNVQARYESKLLHSSSGQHFTLVQYDVPTPASVPHVLAIDQGDSVWFSESGGRFARNFLDVKPQNKIGRIEANGSISEWVLPEDGTSPMGVQFDANGNLWVAERLGNRITRFAKDGTARRYEVPTSDAWPTALAIDSGGNIWFTETRGNKVGRLDTRNGSIVEFEFDRPGVSATGIAIDASDRVWIAGRDANFIGLLTPKAKHFQYFPLSTPDAKPCGIAVDKNGRVWFTQRNAGKLGTIAADGTIQEFALKDRAAGPFLLAVDNNGAIWFSQLWSNKIAKFDPQTHEFEDFPLPDQSSYPAGLAIDSKGNIWFAAQGSNKVGMIARQDLDYFLNRSNNQVDGLVVHDSDQFSFTDLSVPTPQSIPGILEVDRDDTVWFTEMGGGFVGPGFPPGPPGSKIGYVKKGVIGELETPTPNSGPTSLAIDPSNGDIWVTLREANKIAVVRHHEIAELDIPVPNSVPVGITIDTDHNVWIALSAAGALARLSVTGEWRLLYLPDRRGNPRTIFADSHNNIWFTEKDGNRMGLVDREAWVALQWTIPTRVAWPLAMAEDGQGNIWFAEMRADKIAMFDQTAHEIREYRLPSHSAPFKILFDGQHNAFWISTVFGNSVLKFDLRTRRTVAAYRIPNEGVWLGGIARTSDGCLWVTEQFGNRGDRLCLPELVALPTSGR